MKLLIFIFDLDFYILCKNNLWNDIIEAKYWDDSLTRQTWCSTVLLGLLHGGVKVLIFILIFIFAVFAKYYTGKADKETFKRDSVVEKVQI
jgi:hypothetical protein